MKSPQAWDSVALAAAKLAVGVWVLHHGFSHISDDDYARVVISEQFAEAPRLDPSGTSWLPLPFWVDGLVMMAAGRSLEVARGVALALGCASVVAPYLAMRAVGVPRASALPATVVSMVLPWNAWLGAATVPEGWAGALVAASVIAMGANGANGANGAMSARRTRTWAAFGLLAASLCRYEAWPACVVFAFLQVTRSRRELGRALVALSGPAAWMAWNAHAHGSPVHFLARVAAFRHAVGAADVPVSAKILDYPLALLQESPEAAILGLVGALGLCSRELRARWLAPAVSAAAVIGFLVWGDVHDGAPTHHPARALAATWWVFIGMGADTVHTLGNALMSASERRVWRLGSAVGLAVVGAAWCAALPARWNRAPGESTSEQRDAQIGRGKALGAQGVEHAQIAPCAFEHFALLAAWGAPERATVLPASHAPLTAACPTVTVE